MVRINSKLILIITSALVVLGLAIFLVVKFFYQVNEKSQSALYFIPDNAAIIFEIQSADQLTYLRTSPDLIPRMMMSQANMRQLLLLVDSASQDYSKKAELNMQRSKLFFSLHFMGKDKFSGLLSISFETATSKKSMLKSLELLGEIQTIKSRAGEYYKLSYSSANYYWTYLEGNLFISTDNSLIEKLLYDIGSQSTTRIEKIDKLSKIAGSDAELSIFINHQHFYRLLIPLVNPQYYNALHWLSSISSYTVLDMDSDTSLAKLTGMSLDFDSTSNYLSSFNGYEPVATESFSHLPSNTQFCLVWGAQKLNEYLIKNRNLHHSADDLTTIEIFNQKFETNVEEQLISLVNNQLVFGGTTFYSDSAEATFGLFNTFDGKESAQIISELEQKSCVLESKSADTNLYRGYRIYYVPSPYLVSSVFGNVFHKMEEVYMVIIDNYIMFSADKPILNQWVDEYLINRNLTQSEHFKEFGKKINSESHFTFYANVNKVSTRLPSYLNTQGKGQMDELLKQNAQLGDFCMQFIYGSSGSFTSLHWMSNYESSESENSSWQVALESDVAKGPFSFYNAEKGDFEIIVFDQLGNMYRIDEKGSVIWTIPGVELPQGNLQWIDFNGNGQKQFAYNGNNKLFMFDLNGNPVKPFPVKLPMAASGALLMVDFDKLHDYRFIIPLSDGKIYNFDKNLKPLKGWQFPKFNINKGVELQYYKLGTKDFLILNSKGEMAYVNRKGESRMQAQKAFTLSNNYTLNQWDNKIITSDQAGRMLLIEDNGVIEKKVLNSFTGNHILKTNSSGKSAIALVVYDDNQLFAYNRNFESLWNMTEIPTLSSKIEILNQPLASGTEVIGFAPENGKFVFFSAQGQWQIQEDLNGSENYLLLQSSNSQMVRLIVFRGRLVTNYEVN